MKKVSNILTLSILVSCTAEAYIAGSVAAPPGAFDAAIKTELMRGVAGPENRPETQQTLKPNVNIYEGSLGYNFGSLGIWSDFRVGLSGAYFSSGKEELAGTQYYPADTGLYFGIEVSANIIHEVDRIFGFFVRNQNPVGMDVEKFVNPKIDRLGLGLVNAFKFNESFGQESLLYIGSGIADGSLRQNPSLSASMLFAYLFTPSFLKEGAALKLGPFFDADIAERYDAKYNITPRAFRAGLVSQLAIRLSKQWSADLTYVHKFSGAYFRANRDFILALRTSF